MTIPARFSDARLLAATVRSAPQAAGVRVVLASPELAMHDYGGAYVVPLAGTGLTDAEALLAALRLDVDLVALAATDETGPLADRAAATGVKILLWCGEPAVAT